MDRNKATKLTPAERKEKKIRKLVGASGDPALTACVYVVTDLSSMQHQWKVRVNAEVRRPSLVLMLADSGSTSAPTTHWVWAVLCQCCAPPAAVATLQLGC